MAYTSQFTGSEMDEAIRLTLGGTYRGDTGPGCHLIGDKVDMPQDLNDLSIPGKYTVYFFTNGPAGVENIISPICVQVYWAGQFLYQTITIGTKFYWRDLISGDLVWKMVDLGVEAVKIIDNLYTDIETDESADEMALSANMGAELRKMIEQQEIGNINLLDCSGELQGYPGSVDMTRFENYWVNHNATYNVNYRQRLEGESLLPKVVTDISNEENYGMTLFQVNYDGYMLSYGSYIKAYEEFSQAYTASVYVKNTYYNLNSSDISDSDIIYIKIILKDSQDSSNDIVVTKEYKLKDIVNTDEFSTGVFRLSVTINREMFGTVDDAPGKDVTDYTKRTIHVCFGCECNEVVQYVTFYHPKLEYGYYATAYNHSANDLKYWYTNCEKIFDVKINAESPRDFINQDGLVYNSNTKKFDHEAVAVGGGGGFITCNDISQVNSNPRKDKVLAFVNSKTNTSEPKKLVCYDSETGQWIPVTNAALISAIRDSSAYKPVNDSVPYDCGWLDITEETSSIPAVLNYYDARHSKWKPVGAIASKIWICQESAPTNPADQHLIWIKKSTMAPYIYVSGQWRPLLTIWGAST